MPKKPATRNVSDAPSASRAEPASASAESGWGPSDAPKLATAEALARFAPAQELFDFCKPRGAGRNSRACFPDSWMTALRELSVPERLGFLAAAALLGADNCVARALAELVGPQDLPRCDENSSKAHQKDAIAATVAFVAGMRPLVAHCLQEAWEQIQPPAGSSRMPNPEDEKAVESALKRSAALRGQPEMSARPRHFGDWSNALQSMVMAQASTGGAKRLGTALLRMRFPFFGDLAHPSAAAVDAFLNRASKNQARLALRRAGPQGRVELARAALCFLGKSAGAEPDAVAWAILDAVGLEKAVICAREKASEEELFHLAMINAQPKTRPQLEMAMMHLFLSRKTEKAREIAKKGQRHLANRMGNLCFDANSAGKTDGIRALWQRAAEFDLAWAVEILDNGMMRPGYRVHSDIESAAREAVNKTLAQMEANQLSAEMEAARQSQAESLDGGGARAAKPSRKMTRL